jgi:hypothetical protein
MSAYFGAGPQEVRLSFYILSTSRHPWLLAAGLALLIVRTLLSDAKQARGVAYLLITHDISVAHGQRSNNQNETQYLCWGRLTMCGRSPNTNI